MALGLVLEFDGLGRQDYDAVNAKLGIDPTRGTSDWPPGLLYHAGGATAGGWLVFEVWESKEAQERFTNGRLGQAMREAGVGAPPKRVEWLDLAAHTVPQK